MLSGLLSAETLNRSFSFEGTAHLLQQISESVGAEGATLTYSHGSTQFAAVFSESLAQYIPNYLDPDRPPDPRPSRVNPTLAEGFRLDHDDFTSDELARDAFYQEVLRPLGMGWHACALLAGSADGGAVNLTLRRTLKQGPFDQGELGRLTTQLPLIRTLAEITRLMGGLEAMGEPAPSTRRSIYGFDARGRAFIVSEGAAAARLLEVKAGRLRAATAEQQARIEGAVARANANAAQAACVVADEQGDWWLFSVIPASRMSPEELTPFISWAVLAPCEPSEEIRLRRRESLTMLFGLSPAEARVATLIGEARTIDDAAHLLSTSPGTVRNHLKSIFAKVGVNRQAKLVALLSRF